jgi:hypothetical protein
MKTRLAHLVLLMPLIATATFAGSPNQVQAQPLPVADAECKPLGELVPAGAFAYAETSGIAELICRAHGSELYETIMASTSTQEFLASEGSRGLRSGVGWAQFMMRMDLWEAAEKLLGGRAAVAMYPAADRDAESQKPELLVMLHPADRAAWAQQGIWTGPLLALGAKRISRGAVAPEIRIYETRGAEQERKFLALHPGWGMFSSDAELLLRAVALRKAQPEGESLAADGSQLSELAARLPGEHLARAFVDTKLISFAAGGRLGLPEKMDNPLASLLFGGMLEIAAHSELACMALDFEASEFGLKLSLDADPAELDPRFQVFFASGRPTPQIPQIPGLIGGITLHRDLATWYRSRDGLMQEQVLPGFDKFETGIGNILPGKDIGEDVIPLIGNNFTLVSALQDYAHLDGEPGVKLPGFAVILDLAGSNPDAGADMFHLFFQTFLSVLNLQAAEQQRQPWLLAVQQHGGTPITYARYFERPAGEQLPVVFNFLPAAARVGDHYIICTSLGMCQDLVDSIKQPVAAGGAAHDSQTQLEFSTLCAALELNRQHLIANRLNEGRETGHAVEDIEHLFLALAGLGSLTSTATADGEGLKITIRGNLK